MTLVFVVFVATARSQPSSTAAPEPAPTVPSSGAPTTGPEGPIPALGPTIPVGQTPGFVAVSPNGHHAYIANQDTQRITVLDTAVNQVTATIPIPAGPPQFLTFAPHGHRLYVSIFNKQRTIHLVDVIDTASNTVVATIPQPARPFLPAVTRDGKLLYIPNHDTASVSVVDTASNTVIAHIKVTPNPHWVAFSPDGRWAYTANHESDLISVIDTTTREVVATMPVGTSPHSLAVNPTRPLVANVFVQTNNPAGNQIQVYGRADDGALTLAETVDTGGKGGRNEGGDDDPLSSQGSLHYNTDHRLLIAVNAGSDTVSVLELGDDHLYLQQVLPSGGTCPVSVTVHSDLLYVLNAHETGAITGYRITDGKLHPIEHSTRSLNLPPAIGPEQTNNTPAQISFIPDGRHLVITTKGNGSLIDVFTMAADGRPSDTFVANPAGTPFPFGFTFDGDHRLVVTDGLSDTLTTYTIHADGTVTQIASQPDGQKFMCWVVHTAGNFYVADNGSNTLTGYHIDPAGKPTISPESPPGRARSIWHTPAMGNSSTSILAALGASTVSASSPTAPSPRSSPSPVPILCRESPPPKRELSFS